MEEKIKELEDKLEDLECIVCIGCKNKYNYNLPLCELCEHYVCYSCVITVGEDAICPRKICTIIYQMLTNIKTD